MKSSSGCAPSIQQMARRGPGPLVVITLGAAVTLRVSMVTANAGYLWEPPVVATPAASTEEAIVKQIALRPGASTLHAMTRTWLESSNSPNVEATGIYLPVVGASTRAIGRTHGTPVR